MFDILMFLFESYFTAGSYPDTDKLSIKLSAAGFENDDINHALSWLSGLDNLSLADYPDIINHTGLRHFAEYEKQYISQEGLQFILFWEQTRMMTPIEREMIIDRAIAFGRNNLPLDQIKLITLMVLWNQRQEIDPLLIEELLNQAPSSQLH